jgi:ketosteroid isomerase-like protein
LGHIDFIVSMLTADAVFMDATDSRVSGKAQLRTFFATVLKQYRAHPVLHSVRSSSSGALGYDWGDYREEVVPVGAPNKAIKASGTYLVILRNVSGRWLIANQMWTGNEPVPVKR